MPHTPLHCRLDGSSVLLKLSRELGRVRQAVPQHARSTPPDLEPNARGEAALLNVGLGAPPASKSSGQGLHQPLGIGMRSAVAREYDGPVLDATGLQFAGKWRYPGHLTAPHGLHAVFACTRRCRTAYSHVQGRKAPREAGRASEEVCWAQPRT